MQLFENLNRILCFGDSNTYGQQPFKYERYSVSQRWTGLLQAKLNVISNDLMYYEIIEEGLCGRTTGDLNLETTKTNGLNYFLPCIISQYPVNTIIIGLGTNDFKTKYNRTAKQIYTDLMQYKQLVRTNFTDEIHLLFITPASISVEIDGFNGYNQKLTELVILLNESKERDNFEVLDLSSLIATGKDFLHFSLDDHKLVTDKIYSKLNPRKHLD